MARAFINRLRSSMHVTTSPSVASPVEIQERFLFVIAEAVYLATIFNKGAWACESVIYGLELKDLCEQHNGVEEPASGDWSSFQDADHVFCAGLLHFMLDSVSVATVRIDSYCRLLVEVDLGISTDRYVCYCRMFVWEVLYAIIKARIDRIRTDVS